MRLRAFKALLESSGEQVQVWYEPGMPPALKRSVQAIGEKVSKKLDDEGCDMVDCSSVPYDWEEALREAGMSAWVAEGVFLLDRDSYEDYIKDNEYDIDDLQDVAPIHRWLVVEGYIVDPTVSQFTADDVVFRKTLAGIDRSMYLEG